MQKSIVDLTEEVNSISPASIEEYDSRSCSPAQAQTSGRAEDSTDELADVTSKLSSVNIDKVSTSPSLKLPHLFSITPNSLGRATQTQSPKQHAIAIQPSWKETLTVAKSADPPFANDRMDNVAQDSESYYAQNLRRSVREAALSRPSSNSDWSEDKSSDDSSEHFFIPLSTGLPWKETDAVPNRRKQRLVFSSPETRNIKTIRNHFSDDEGNLYSAPNALTDLTVHGDYINQVNGFQHTDSDLWRKVMNNNESLDQVYSPSLSMDDSFFTDTCDDLLAPLSETDAALMER